MRIWATANNVWHIAARDSRLGAGTDFDDTPKGQHGWHWGINFTRFHDLALTLTQGKVKPPAGVCSNVWYDCDPPGPGDITQLAILAHGAPGKVDVDSKAGPAEIGAPTLNEVDCLSVDTIPHNFDRTLALFDKALAPNAVVYLMACNAGFGSGYEEGTDFLRTLSSWLWGRSIVAYCCYGWADFQLQLRGDSECEPGMRLLGTDNWGDTSRKEFVYDNWNDLETLPWARIYSPYAKVAHNGNIIHGGHL